ncbi:MAG: hypothetical protein GDA39_10160 [Hyphomonadaceae bacterium]|nr:hypothetical protein [Hyphomonadaceae bacterium]MBC6413196.1 hypothetical protein [Hyphomonadaceae bacterium]
MAPKIYEKEIDELFLRHLQHDAPDFRERLFKEFGIDSPAAVDAISQTPHEGEGKAGTIDIGIRLPCGRRYLIENKINARFSATQSGVGQPERYRKTVKALRDESVDAFSVLLAPQKYLRATKMSDSFDYKVPYESFLDIMTGEDKELLKAAIEQAEKTPPEPDPNVKTGDFFESVGGIASLEFPELVLKPNPNPSGARYENSRTFYFDVPKTLCLHSEIRKPRMSLQCRDSGEPSASVKIMIGKGGRFKDRLEKPPSLVDIGAYLRPAGRSLGIVIDTPRLETQYNFSDQIDKVRECLEAAMRLKGWWDENVETLKSWHDLIDKLV